MQRLDHETHLIWFIRSKGGGWGGGGGGSVVSAHPRSCTRAPRSPFYVLTRIQGFRRPSHVCRSPSCHVEYVPLENSSLVPELALSLGLGLGLVILMLLVSWYAFAHKRNNTFAPKDSTRPFCIIFTDIQSSTHLWATVPEAMVPALDAHHLLIRQLIKRYKLYEVKTIGDAFMCTTSSPTQALRFALALQSAFNAHDWGSTHINEVYGEVANETPDTDCWNGLRVRVGVHYGDGSIRFDPVSKGYDYYGTVVNTAARIESVCHGGQIGLSKETVDALDQVPLPPCRCHCPCTVHGGRSGVDLICGPCPALRSLPAPPPLPPPAPSPRHWRGRSGSAQRDNCRTLTR